MAENLENAERGVGQVPRTFISPGAVPRRGVEIGRTLVLSFSWIRGVAKRIVRLFGSG
jgi:hypothetical protein